jgi:uncharacterized membrane protein YtjA (UPF0391 family)
LQRLAAVRLETNSYSSISGETTMLYWALMFFVFALVAALFGFGGIAAGAASIAKILFVVFLVLFVISLLTGWSRRPIP